MFNLFRKKPSNPRVGSFEREFHAPRFQEELQSLRSQIASRDRALKRIATISREMEVLKIARQFA